MAKSNNLGDFLRDLKEGIQAKTGTTGTMNPQDFRSAIESISTMPSEVAEVVKDISGVESTNGMTLANAIAKSYADEPSNNVIMSRATADGGSIKDGVAFVEKMKGNTMKMSQICEDNFLTNANKWKSAYATNLEVALSGGVLTATYVATPTGSTYNMHIKKAINANNGHKYIAVARVYVPKECNFQLFYQGGGRGIVPMVVGWNDIYAVYSYTADAQNTYIGVNSASSWGYAIGDSWKISSIGYYDLTDMGLEDVTDGETFLSKVGFNSLSDLLDNQYPTFEGVLSLNADKVVSKSRNLWNGSVMHNGAYISYLGAIANSANYNVSNFMEIKPSEEYCLLGTSGANPAVCFYDYDKNFISGENYGSATMKVVTAPDNARYMRFSIPVVNADTFCVNISDSQDGDTTPYFTDELPTNISTIMKDGSALFPNGLNAVGDIHDEITPTKAIKRIGVVNLGNLTWSKQNPLSGEGYCFRALVEDIKGISATGIGNILCIKYTSSTRNNCLYSPSTHDKIISVYTDLNVRVVDMSFADTNAFKSGMSGVMLYYQLAEPIEVDIAEKKAFYKVSQNGKESIHSTELSAPLKADIAYRGMSAEELINELNG